MSKTEEQTLKEYRYIGRHAEELDGGRQLAPGDYTGGIETEKGSHNADLLDEGLLIEVPEGTTEKQARVESATHARQVQLERQAEEEQEEGK
jgi:hypothetical protein